jgi:hypothetical protein
MLASYYDDCPMLLVECEAEEQRFMALTVNHDRPLVKHVSLCGGVGFAFLVGWNVTLNLSKHAEKDRNFSRA